MIFNSYRKKLVALFIIIAAIPIAIIAIGLNITLGDYITKDREQIKIEYITNEAEKVESWLGSNEQVLKVISSNYPIIKDMMNEEDAFKNIGEYLNSYKVNYEPMLNLYITMQDGRNFNSAKLELDEDTRERPWYTNLIKIIRRNNPERIVWTQPYEDVITGEMVITVSMALLSENGKLEGVIGADFSFQEVMNTLSEIKAHDNSSTYVLNSTGKLQTVYGKDILVEDENYGVNIDNYISSIYKAKHNSTLLELDDTYLCVHSTIPSMNWTIASLTPREDFYMSVLKLNQYILISVVITLVVIAVLSMTLSSIFTKPLEKLSQGAIEIQKGNYNHKVILKEKDEFGNLADTFNGMADKLEDSYKNISEQQEMLIQANNHLQELNMELEASYEQLMATTEQLDISEEKHRTLIENMYDLVWVIDEDGKVEFINDQIKEMLKYEKSDIIGKDIRDLGHIWENNFENLIDKMRKRDYKNLELEHIDKAGNIITVELNTKRIYENEKLIGIQGVARDITKRKSMEEEVLKRNQELSTINEISINLNSTLSLENLLDGVTNDITKMLDIELCTIRLLDKKGQNLKLMAQSGRLSHILLEEEIPVDEDITGEVVKTGNVLVIDSVSNKHTNKYNSKVLDQKDIDNITIMPLKARGKVLGVMVVTTKKELDESDFNILSSLTNQITMIIENINLYQGLKDSYMKTIETLAAAVEAKDQYTEGHSLRVAKYSVMIAKYIGLPKKFCEDIEVAGILHDIGKIGISDRILMKPGRLTEEEYGVITQHPMIGSRILKSVGLSDTIMNAIKYHHKRYDLKGYPHDNIDDLPLEAAIIGVADAFDAMTSSRSYRVAIDIKCAISEIVKNKGKQFHPYIADILIDIYKNNPIAIEEIVTDQIEVS